jgi:hypothetical protein
MKKISLITILTFSVIIQNLKAQCDERASACLPKLKPFNSNGQYYRVQLVDNEIGKIKLTFNSNLVYRIASCNKSSDGKALVIKIFDTNGKQVFSNESDTGHFWDIQFGATSQYVIQASYPSGHGCVALLIGYMPKDKYAQIK